MSRVKMWMGILALMVMALALGTSGAMASTITFNADHAMTITLMKGLTPVYPGSGTVSSGVSGQADYPSETNSANSGIIPISGLTVATANATPGTWLLTGDTHTQFDANKITGHFYRYFTGSGPNPSGATPGYITQSNADSNTQTLHLEWTGLTNGAYNFTLSDVYTSLLSLNQAGGNSVYSLDASAYLLYNIHYSAFQFNNNSSLIQTYSNDTYPDAIPGFTLTSSGTAAPILNFTVSAAQGRTLTVDITLSSGYEAYTLPLPVPLPSTMLLLGSGLVGLGLLRRKWRFKK